MNDILKATVDACNWVVVDTAAPPGMRVWSLHNSTEAANSMCRHLSKHAAPNVDAPSVIHRAHLPPHLMSEMDQATEAIIRSESLQSLDGTMLALMNTFCVHELESMPATEGHAAPSIPGVPDILKMLSGLIPIFTAPPTKSKQQQIESMAERIFLACSVLPGFMQAAAEFQAGFAFERAECFYDVLHRRRSAAPE